MWRPSITRSGQRVNKRLRTKKTRKKRRKRRRKRIKAISQIKYSLQLTFLLHKLRLTRLHKKKKRSIVRRIIREKRTRNLPTRLC